MSSTPAIQWFVPHSSAVYKGFALAHAITRSDYGGRDVTNRLQVVLAPYRRRRASLTFSHRPLWLQLLLRRGGYVFHTSAEKEIVRTIKEAHCYVALNPEREESLELQQHTSMDCFRHARNLLHQKPPVSSDYCPTRSLPAPFQRSHPDIQTARWHARASPSMLD